MDPLLTSALLIAHAIASTYMMGLIWFVQVVHYPLMAEVGEPGFIDYEQKHVRRTTWVVAPAMLIEMLAACLLLFARPAGVPLWLIILGLACLLGIWLSTALLQVPRHRELESGFNRQSIARLVRSNWLRTFLWTGRAAMAMTMLFL